MKRRGMVHRAALMASGLAMATSLGLAGAGIASSATPSLKIKAGAVWTLRPVGGGSPCEWDKFHTTKDTFVSTSERGDAGTFSQTKTTIDMTWTAGELTGLTFQGTWQGKYYIGAYGGITTGPGTLVRGARPIC